MNDREKALEWFNQLHELVKFRDAEKHVETIRQALKPETDVYYCENGGKLEGLEKAALAVLSNIMIKTNSNKAQFMIGNEKDGDFYFTCQRTQALQQPPVDVGNYIEVLDMITSAKGLYQLSNILSNYEHRIKELRHFLAAKEYLKGDTNES